MLLVSCPDQRSNDTSLNICKRRCKKLVCMCRRTNHITKVFFRATTLFQSIHTALQKFIGRLFQILKQVQKLGLVSQNLSFLCWIWAQFIHTMKSLLSLPLVICLLRAPNRGKCLILSSQLRRFGPQFALGSHWL